MGFPTQVSPELNKVAAGQKVCCWSLCPHFIHRNRWRPAALVVLEADLWPSMLAQCVRAGIPLALVDARISERSAARWALPMLRPLIFFLLSHFRLLLCQSSADEARLRALGAGSTSGHWPEGMHSIGSIKSAAGPLPVNDATVQAVQHALKGGKGGVRRVWVAASTHEFEEEMVLRTSFILVSFLTGHMCGAMPLCLRTHAHAVTACAGSVRVVERVSCL